MESSVVVGNTKEMQNAAPLKVEPRVFFKSVDESCGLKCLHVLSCTCFLPRYTLTQQSVRIETYGCCTEDSNTIDVDKILDLSLTQTMSPAYCCYGEGHIRLYVGNDKEDKVVVMRNIQNASKVFDEYSTFIHEINSMKFGIKRPEIKDVPHLIYDSDMDNIGLKCLRCLCCCGCWCFPHTIVSKAKISTTSWNLKCQRNTQQIDMDNVTHVELKRSLCHCCVCGSGSIHVTGTDKDQKNMVIKHVGNSHAVFKKMDETCNVLNNRDRVLGMAEHNPNVVQ